MNYSVAVETIRKYSDQYGFQVIDCGDKMFELKRQNTSRRLFLTIHADDSPADSSVSIEFCWVIGVIHDLRSCIQLMHIGRWKPSSFYLTAKEFNDTHFLCAEAEAYFPPEFNSEQAYDILFYDWMLPLFSLEWPDGVEILE